MATTKSTVVGIRLDHERRAWVEAEAARRGLSVRGLFEGMIDEARSGEMVGDARPTVAAASSPPAAVGASTDEVAAMSGPEEPAASGAPDSVHAAPARGRTGHVVTSLRHRFGGGRTREPRARSALLDGEPHRFERSLCHQQAWTVRVNAALGQALGVNTSTRRFQLVLHASLLIVSRGTPVASR